MTAFPVRTHNIPPFSYQIWEEEEEEEEKPRLSMHFAKKIPPFSFLLL